MKLALEEKPPRFRRFSRKDDDNWFNKIKNHPNFIEGSIPAKDALSFRAREQDPNRPDDLTLNTHQAFKAGFALRIEDGLTDEQTEELAKTAVDPMSLGLLARVGGAVARPITNIVGPVAGTALSKYLDLLGAAAIGGPAIAGLAGGYGLAKLHNLHDHDDTDVMKSENLAAEYKRLADSAEQKAKMRKLDMRDGTPGDVIQLS